jgi:hypothetical protein
MIRTVRFNLFTSGQGDAHDITAKAAGALNEFVYLHRDLGLSLIFA